jgi:hypothetical protein
MWGAKGGILPYMGASIRAWRLKRLLKFRGSYNEKGLDQVFLNQVIYPVVKHDVLIHSDLVRFENEQVFPFPVSRKGHEFVGQGFYDKKPTSDCATSREQMRTMTLYKMPDFSSFSRFKRKWRTITHAWHSKMI